MKLLLVVLSGCALFTSSFLSAEPSGNRCNCKNCGCTKEYHCGCLSKAGCKCSPQQCQCSENCKCGDNCQCGISCACK